MFVFVVLNNYISTFVTRTVLGQRKDDQFQEFNRIKYRERHMAGNTIKNEAFRCDIRLKLNLNVHAESTTLIPTLL